VLLIIILVMSIPEWLAFIIWWRVHRKVEDEYRKLAKDRAAAGRGSSGYSGHEEEQTEEHVVHSEGVEDLPPDGAHVAGWGDWGEGTPMPPMRETSPPPGED
jgi:hypothetical protein